MGKYINRGLEGFKRYTNGDYVDKTGLIGYVNSTISTADMLTCVTRPRRFGKTAAAQMLYAYYDKYSNSRHLFENYQIAQHTESLRSSKNHARLVEIVKTSDRLLEATLAKNETVVAELIEKLHNHQASPDFYNNEQALRSVLKLGYLSAIDHFVTIQELPSGKGYADLVLIPRRDSKAPVVIIELKWNQPAYTAIRQIRDRNYPDALRGFTDNILLVGISYDTETKQHTCKIEMENVTK